MNNKYCQFLRFLLSFRLDDRWAKMYTVTRDIEDGKELPQLQSRKLIRQSKERELIAANVKYMRNRIETKYGIIELFKIRMLQLCVRTGTEAMLFEFLVREEDWLLKILNKWPQKYGSSASGGVIQAGGSAKAKVEGDANESVPAGDETAAPEEADPTHIAKQEEYKYLVQYKYNSVSNSTKSSESDMDLDLEEAELDATEENQEEKGAEALSLSADKKQVQTKTFQMKSKNMDKLTSYMTVSVKLLNLCMAHMKLLDGRIVQTVITSLFDKFKYILNDFLINFKALEAIAETNQTEHDTFVLEEPISPPFADVKLAEARAKGAVERKLLQTKQFKTGDNLLIKRHAFLSANVKLFVDAFFTTVQHVEEKRENYKKLAGNVPLELPAVSCDVSESHDETVTQYKPDAKIQSMEKNKEITDGDESSAETEFVEAVTMLVRQEEQVYKAFAAVMLNEFWRSLNILKEWNLEELDQFVLQKICNGQINLSPKSDIMKLLSDDFFGEDNYSDSSDNDEDLLQENPIS